jgi:haloalkane dehalogenase
MATSIPTRPDWLTHDLLPFESRYLELDGHLIHYLDEGTGPTLLMLHGNPTWSFLYRHMIAGLRDRFRCVALDLPGFGLSRAAEGYSFFPEDHADVVESFVNRLDLQRYTPVVQDWGGPIGLAVAARAPERVRSLVILNTWAWPVDDDPHFVRFSGLMGGAVGGFFIRHFNAFVNVMIPLGTPRRSLPTDVMRAYRRPLDTPARREPSHIFPNRIVGSTDFLTRLEAQLPALTAHPTLIVWGDRDIAFRDKERARFEALFPDHWTRIVPGAGHFMQEDASAETVDAIRSWWL